jgi:L-threonylcarbamoyladenylate synthase
MHLQSDDEAIAILLQGGVGVLPTDTVYGIAARATDQSAVARMYALKKREHKPGTVIAADIEQLVSLGLESRYLDSIAQYWPGPISFIIPAGDTLAYLHQDVGGLAVRVTDSKAMRALLNKTGPLVTSSANQPGEPPANTVDEAWQYFQDQVDFYVDGGDLAGHQPSTLVRTTDTGLLILRQGAVQIPLDKQSL